MIDDVQASREPVVVLQRSLRRSTRPAMRDASTRSELEAYWAFSVDDDPPVLFRWKGDEAFLVNLGSHDQVC